MIVYNQFVSALVQRVVERDLSRSREEALARDEAEEKEEALLGDFIYKPSLRRSCSGCSGLRRDQLYQLRCSSRRLRSRGARMTAMRCVGQRGQYDLRA